MDAAAKSELNAELTLADWLEMDACTEETSLEMDDRTDDTRLEASEAWLALADRELATELAAEDWAFRTELAADAAADAADERADETDEASCARATAAKAGRTIAEKRMLMVKKW